MTQLEFNLTYDDQIELPTGYQPVEANKPCECGVSVLGYSKHSDYCPLYKPEGSTYEP